MDSFGNRLKRIARKVNERLEDTISAAEQRLKEDEDQAMALRQQAIAIEKDKQAEEDLLRRFNEKVGCATEQPLAQPSTGIAKDTDVSAEEIAEPPISTDAEESKIQRFLPVIVNIIKEKAGPSIVDILSDPKRLSALAESTYQALPLPVRLLLKEQVFVEWILSHQGRIVDAMRSEAGPSEYADSVQAALAPSKSDLQSARANAEGMGESDS
jgi:hypothetical protein